MWDLNLSSPLASAYLLEDALISIPFTIMSNHTLSNLAMELLDIDSYHQSHPSYMKL